MILRRCKKVHGIGDESGPATVSSAHVGGGEDQFDFELDLGAVLSHSAYIVTVNQCFSSHESIPGPRINSMGNKFCLPAKKSI